MHLFASRQVTAYFHARYGFSFTFPALQNLHIMPHDALQLSPHLLGSHPDYADAAPSCDFSLTRFAAVFFSGAACLAALHAAARL